MERSASVTRVRLADPLEQLAVLAGPVGPQVGDDAGHPVEPARHLGELPAQRLVPGARRAVLGRQLAADLGGGHVHDDQSEHRPHGEGGSDHGNDDDHGHEYAEGVCPGSGTPPGSTPSEQGIQGLRAVATAAS